MLNSGNKVRCGNTTSSDIPQLPQYLPLDPITIQKYSSTDDLRKVLGVPHTGSFRDHSLAVPQLKATCSLASGELKHFKESFQNDSRNARDKAKMLKELLVKLDKYEEALSSKKRKRSETNQRYSGVRTGKMGSQNPKIPKHIISQSHGPVDQSGDGRMIKHIQTSLADVQVEDIPLVVQQSKQDQVFGNSTAIGNVRIEEKTRRLLAGGEGLDQKVKKKRSVGAVYSRELSCVGEKKHDSHPKLSVDTKLQSDAQRIRLKSRPGVSSIKNGNNQKSTTLPRENIAEPNLRAMPKANDRSNTRQDFPASSHNSNVKGKVSKASFNSMSMKLDTTVVHPPSGACSGTSMLPMTRWVGQRLQKSSRSRRAIALPPSSRKFEVLDSSQGSPTSDSFVLTTTSDHTCTRVDNVQEFTKESDISSTACQLPKSARSGAGENETLGKGTFRSKSELTTRRSGSSTFRMRRNKTNESGDNVHEQGKIRADSSSRKPGIPSIKEKLENLPITMSHQSTKPSDKGRSKSGRPPVIKQGHRYQTQVGQKSHSSTDLTGRFEDDREELILAANSAFNARSLACSGPLWKKLEPVFASVGADNLSYLKQQRNIAETCGDLLQECNANDYILGITPSLEQTGSDHVMEISPGALSEKSSMQRLEKPTPLYQRVLSALIEEDEAGESYRFGEIRNMPLQYASDDSFCGSCNPIDVELKERDRVDSEVESEVDLQNQKIYLDILSSDKSVTSNTKRNPNMSSSLQSTGVWHGDDDCSHSEITYNNEICSYDIGQVQTADSNLPGFSSTEVQHQLLCLENRLLMELHSIGLYPETLPDLLDGDEAINEDIIELKNRLHQQMEWKRKTLGNVEKAIENEQDNEKQKMEQAALDQLVEIAYRKQLACRRIASKNAARKGSKQVALAFLKRTLLRCKRYEETGNVCFDGLALQSTALSSPIVDADDAKISDCFGSAATSNKCSKPLQVEAQTLGDVTVSTEGRESLGHNLDRRLLQSNKGVISSSELLSSVKESLYDKEMRDVPTKNAIGESRVLTLRGAKRKRCETDKHYRRDHTKSTALSIANQLPVENCQNGRIGNAELKQKDSRAKNQNRSTEVVESTHLPTNQLSQTVVNPGSIDAEGKRTGNVNLKDTELSSIPGKLGLPVLDTMDDLDAANGLDGHQDLGSWLTFDDDGLLEYDSLGLATPMDDLSEILGMNM